MERIAENEARSRFMNVKVMDSKGNEYVTLICNKFSADRAEGVVLGASGIIDIAGLTMLRTALREKRKVYFEGQRYGFYGRKYERHENEYDMHVHRLGFGHFHFVLIAKAKNILLSENPDTLWTMLMGEEYTTPLLKHWMPWLLTKMKEKRYIRQARTHECSMSIVKMSTSQLDQLVEEGIQSGALIVGREPKVEEAEEENKPKSALAVA